MTRAPHRFRASSLGLRQPLTEDAACLSAAIRPCAAAKQSRAGVEGWLRHRSGISRSASDQPHDLSRPRFEQPQLPTAGVKIAIHACRSARDNASEDTGPAFARAIVSLVRAAGSRVGSLDGILGWMGATWHARQPVAPRQAAGRVGPSPSVRPTTVQPLSLPGVAKVTVTSEDGSTTKTYSLTLIPSTMHHQAGRRSGRRQRLTGSGSADTRRP